jgi:hypothetical protein
MLPLVSKDAVDIKQLSRELLEPWWHAAIANHHDFITGTSPDRVVEQEQMPWLDEAIQKVEIQLQELTPDPLPMVIQVVSEDLPAYTKGDGQVHIKTRDFIVELTERYGGTITQALPAESHNPILEGCSNDVVSYRDSGGLWRMGYEFNGGTWKIDDQTSQRPAKLDILHSNQSLEISSTMELRGQLIHKSMWLSNKSRWIHFRISGRAASRHTYTVRFILSLNVSQLVMDSPGGIITRPLKKVYDPTYWPLHQFLHLVDDTSGEGIAVFQRYPGGVSFDQDGKLELIALRNVSRERAYALLPLSGNPARGSEKEDYAFDYALMFTPYGNWKENRLPQIAQSFRLSVQEDRRRQLWTLASSHFILDREDVTVMAAKAASRGEGWILRLYSPSAGDKSLQLRCLRREIVEAYLCDARERDLSQLEVDEGQVHLRMPGTIATLRLLF